MNKLFSKKKSILALAVCIAMAIPSVSFAQDQQTKMDPAARAQRQTEMMQKSLKLNDDQATKVRDINTKYATKMQETMQGGGTAANRDQIMQDKNAEMKGVLTADQYTQYQQMQQKMMQHRQMQNASNGSASGN